MNSQWMTTLFSKGFSKGIELEQGLRKGLETRRDRLKKELETRGLRLSAADLAALLEDVAPAASRGALNAALEFLRPFTAGLGFRVARLADTQVEIVIPERPRNLSDDGRVHEGVCVSAGLEAARLLWERHAPLGRFETEVKSLSFEQHRRGQGDLRVRLEVTETARENLLSQLRREREALSEMSLRFIDEGGQAVADMNLALKLKHTPSLEAPEE